MRYLIIELFEKMYHGKLQSLVWDATLVPRLMGTNMATGNQQKHLEFTLGISKPFFSLLNFHIDIDAFYYMLADQTSKKHKASRCFHVRDMFRAAILLSRNAQKSKIQTALFSKQIMLSC